jgi:hypothetical protein
MTTHDDISDADVLQAAATCLTAVPTAGRPALETVMARGSRRRRAVTGLTLTAGTGAVVLALSLATVFAGHGRTDEATTVRTAAFTLTENTNGTVSLRLTNSQLFDPAALQRALRQDHIPALVTTDTFCTSRPSPGSAQALGIISIQHSDGTPLASSPASSPADQPQPSAASAPIPDEVVTVINPAPIPAHAELFFDFVHTNLLLVALIDTGAHTCTSGLPTH